MGYSRSLAVSDFLSSTNQRQGRPDAGHLDHPMNGPLGNIA
jgi:hypothetical protein